MLLIDFEQPQAKAFSRGFLKGLGAPFLLYGTFKAAPLPEIKMVTPFNNTSADALAGDWLKVGAGIQAAMGKYGEKARNT